MKSLRRLTFERTSSGVPNKSQVPLLVRDNMMKFCSWNGRAIIHHDPLIRRRKIREIELLCACFGVVGLLEVHGNPVSLRAALSTCLRSHNLVYSFIHDTNGKVVEDSGGVAFLVSKDLGDQQQLWGDLTQVHQGRAIAVSIWDMGRTRETKFLLIHNFGFSVPQVKHVINYIESERRRVGISPHNAAVVLMGDFNLERDCASRFSVSKPVFQDPSPLNPTANRPHAAKWNSLFEKFTEVEFPSPSHFPLKIVFARKLIVFSFSLFDHQWSS